jgi:hypothetical protein
MIIYISKAARPLQSEEVELLAASSAAKNRQVAVTGLLLQVGNFYVQVLEGRPWRLSYLLEKIERDARHSDLSVIYKAPAQSRLFGQWNMGYFNIEKYYHANELDVPRLRQFAEEAFATSKTSQHALVQVIRSIPAICFT